MGATKSDLTGPSEKDIVYTALEESMKDTVRNVFEMSEEIKCNMRIAAFVIAIKKLANTYEDTGLFM